MKARGYYRPSRHGKDIADRKALAFVHNELPTPPEHLDEIAQDIWMSTLGQAMRLYGYISYIDLKLFEQYCEVYSELKFLNEVCKNTDMFVYNDKGVPSTHPIFKERKDKRNTFLRLTNEFGFSPSSRTKITLQDPPEEEEQGEDEFEL